MAGVHTGTASRALNDRTASMVSPQTMERVREAADALGYRVNRVARGLKTSRSFTIGMLVPDITNPFFPPMVRGAGDGLSQAGYTLVLADTDNDPGKERLHQTLMLERQVDGLLLATAGRRDDVIKELITTGLPFVLGHRTSTGVGCRPSSRTTRPAWRSRSTTSTPWAIGSSGISRVPRRRRRGLGARPDSKRGPFVGCRAGADDPGTVFTVEGGRAVAEGLLTGSARPSAIVAANDLIALGALDVAASLGLSCPADFSLVGFNDMPFVDRLRPPLTTVRVDEHALGLRASRMLLSHIEDPRPAARRSCSRRSSSSGGRPPPPFDLVNGGFKVV